jgi:hypothetical protein
MDVSVDFWRRQDERLTMIRAEQARGVLRSDVAR